MSFPDSFSSFDRIDVSDSVDMVEKLDTILNKVSGNAGKLLVVQNTQSEMKSCLDTLCSKENLSATNDAGWRVII
jgi:hypothetical protein